jgi:DNA-binding transcriptional MerR regulator
MRLIDCARQAGVSADTLRHYLRVGLMEADGRCENGYRTFSQRSVARLHFIRSALALGFTLRDAGELVEMGQRGELPCPRARALLDQRLAAQGRQLDDALRLHRRMRQAVADWKTRPDGVPDGHSVCGLIEGFAADIPLSSRDPRATSSRPPPDASSNR